METSEMVTAPPTWSEVAAGAAPPLLRLAVLLTGNVTDGEDLLQTTFTRACRHGDRIAAMAAPHAYLRTVMVNEHTSGHRSMSTWTDEQLARLLTHTMTDHAGDADPERATRIARAAPADRPRGPIRGHWSWVVVAATTVALIVGVTWAAHAYRDRQVLDIAAPSPGRHATPPLGTGQVGTTSQNTAIAAAASRATIASLRLPDRAVRLNDQPKGWPGGGTYLGPSDSRLTQTRWWSVPLAKHQVAAYLTTHTPDGLEHPKGEDAIDAGGSDGVESAEYDEITDPDPTARSGVSLLVQFARVGDHTVVRADTFLYARFAVPASARITADVSSIQITAVGRQDSAATDPLAPITLAGSGSASQIERLVRAFNSLDGSPTRTSGVYNCPMIPNPPPSDTLTFITADHTITASLEHSCFSQVHVRVDGSPLPVTLDPGRLSLVIRQIRLASGS